MDEIDVFSRMNAIENYAQTSLIFGDDEKLSSRVSEHKVWLNSI